tara:strand:- start:40 stop:1359 length:1320 start_codon:yes stop_codon:yes gene_type:complete
MILSHKIIFISVFIQLSNNEYKYTVEDYNIKKENLISLELEVIPFQNIDKINLDLYELIVKNKEYYFVNNASGLVYKVQDDNLRRVDNSLDNRLLKDSYIFQHNDTIFRYGGYGFWSQRDFIIYYDESISEWEIYNTNNNSYSPAGSYKGVYFKNKNDVYFIGGQKVDEKNKLESIDNQDVVKFNFKTRSFEYLGKLNFNFDVYSLIVKDDDGFVINNGSQIAYIKPIENKVLLYDKTPLQLNLKNYEGKVTNNYFFDESYFLEVFSNQNFETNLFKISKSDFFKNNIEESKLYDRSLEDSINVSTLFFIIIFITLILFAFDRYRFNKIILSPNGIIFKRVLNKLNSKEINVIIKLINNEAITTKSILDIVENPNLSYPHNIKIKDRFVRDLNLRLSVIFNISYEPIIVKKSITDARIKEYFFKDEFKAVVKRFSINVY